MFCYFLQINSNWQFFLFILSWVHLGLAFFEPAHSNQDYYFDQHPKHRAIAIAIEGSILAIYLFELFMEIYHKRSDTLRTFKEKYITNRKMLCKILIDAFFTLDFLIFYFIPGIHFRVSRIFRPCKA
jgi:hypothetical protein